MNNGEKFGLVVCLFSLFGIVFMHQPETFSPNDWALFTAAIFGAVIFIVWRWANG